MRHGGWISMAAALACLLAACTSPLTTPPPATPQAMAAADPPAAKPNWVVKHAVAIGDVVGSLAPDASSPSAVGADAFRQALEQSLQSAGYLASGGKPHYHLDATLQELDQPKFSLTDDTAVSARVQYRLIGPGTDAQYTVISNGTATFDESSLFGKRLQLADERAIQANIEQLLAKLQKF
ncbi:MAG: hypothetical protein KGI46_09870 [Alphaproteobacteria bacterium]|nr:hypothetical protein [Alphaproteobacteria bacterium]